MNIKDVLYTLVDDDGFIKNPEYVSKQIESYADEFAKKFAEYFSYVRHNEGFATPIDELLTEFKKTL